MSISLLLPIGSFDFLLFLLLKQKKASRAKARFFYPLHLKKSRPSETFETASDFLSAHNHI